MHAVDDASGPRLILMMRRYGAGVLLLIQRRIVESRNACWRPILPAHHLKRALALLAAAPYVHPRLSSIQLKGDDDGSGLTVIIKKFSYAEDDDLNSRT